jgi:hypothetical protein
MRLLPPRQVVSLHRPLQRVSNTGEACRPGSLHKKLGRAGFGLSTWPTIYPAYSEYDELAFVNHAHNDWAEWAGDGGIPFAALMGLVALRAVWLCPRAPWGIGIVTVFVHSLVDFPLQRPTVMLWLVTMLGCLESTRAERTSRSDSYPKHKAVAGESAVALAGKLGVR